MEDQSQAISFANSYFSLIDGLAPGLENHLAKDVVLDWFGRTIRGRENVTEFIKFHKIGSRHVFNNITPVNCINYRKSRTNRKIQNSKTDNCNVTSLLNEELNFDKLSIEDPENNNVLFKGTADFGESDVSDFEGNKTSDEISTTYELRENDLANLFNLKIPPTRSDGEENEKSIDEIKNGRKFINGKSFGIENFSKTGGEFNSDVKYVEANGQIEFFKKSNKRGTDFQTWRRQSKLQIAYSLITSENFYEEDQEEEEEAEDEEVEEEFDYREMETDDLPVTESTQKSVNKIINRLPSLEEITDISNNLVPNINNFGGYLPSFDFLADRNNFLENFNAELSVRNSMIFLRTPQYVDNRLVFTEINDKLKPSCRDDDDGDQGVDKYEGNHGFVFNYLIHLIIYQGSSKCRRSLSQEFESTSKNTKRGF